MDVVVDFCDLKVHGVYFEIFYIDMISLESNPRLENAVLETLIHLLNLKQIFTRYYLLASREALQPLLFQNPLTMYYMFN